MIISKCGVNLNITDLPPDLDDLNQFWQNIFPIWENETYEWILPRLDVDKTFLDIGAWQGPISMIAQKYSKQCICFEPDPVAFHYLDSNIKLNNFTNIIVENLAVSMEPHLALSGPNGKFGGGCTSFTMGENIITCPTISILEILNKYNLNERDISVIKIDIEGYESVLLKDPIFKFLNVDYHISMHPALFSDRGAYNETMKECLLNNFKHTFIPENKDYYELKIERKK